MNLLPSGTLWRSTDTTLHHMRQQQSITLRPAVKMTMSQMTSRYVFRDSKLLDAV
jgi:hypothetical protein